MGETWFIIGVSLWLFVIRADAFQVNHSHQQQKNEGGGGKKKSEGTISSFKGY